MANGSKSFTKNRHAVLFQPHRPAAGLTSKTDTEGSSPERTFLAHASEELLSPDQIVPVEIPIRPTGMLWHTGEQLRVVVAGYKLKGPMFPGIPLAPTRNRGEHIIPAGGQYASHLLVPKIPGDG